MGTFYHPIRVGRLDGSAFETIEALVDTGATWTWIPRPILDRLAIPVTDHRELQMANGQIVERESGWVLATAGGVTVPTICIFGDPDSIPLLGAVTLEECSLAADPVRRAPPAPQPRRRLLLERGLIQQISAGQPEQRSR